MHYTIIGSYKEILKTYLIIIMRFIMLLKIFYWILTIKIKMKQDNMENNIFILFIYDKYVNANFLLLINL